MKNALLATGRVESLCINGLPVDAIHFSLEGPRGDTHAGFRRKLSNHDGPYLRTSLLKKREEVFNWRSWTGLASEEVRMIEADLGVDIPAGCLLENLTLSGVPGFSKLKPSTRLVFPQRLAQSSYWTQAILAVWEENGPCHGVSDRLAQHHGKPELKTSLIARAQNRRGVMGFVLAAGQVKVGDTVLVYPPAE